MASTFKFHTKVNEIVPFNAQYEFPAQATRQQKAIVKIPPKNGGDFGPKKRILFEMPADNYLHCGNSYMLFDIEWFGKDILNLQWQRGGVQNVIKRLRIMYGSKVLEDIREYKTLVRIFQEAGVPQDFRHSIGNVLEGMNANMDFDDPATSLLGVANSAGNGDSILACAATARAGGSAPPGFAIRIEVTQAQLAAATRPNDSGLNYSETDLLANTRLTVLAGASHDHRTIAKSGVNPDTGVLNLLLDYPIKVADGAEVAISVSTVVTLPSTNVATDVIGYDTVFEQAHKRTYCLNLMSGLLASNKLLPLKWMASQLTFEITLSEVEDCALWERTLEMKAPPTFKLTDPYFVAEMIEFDSTYDQAFYMGLQAGGVPIKISSWHHYSFNINGNSTTCQIHDRSRSVKSVFAVVRDASGLSGSKDSDRFYHALGQQYQTDGSGRMLQNTRRNGAIEQFQWRLGGRFYPSQPVRCEYGAAEAMVELTKCLGYFGNYMMANAISMYNWSTLGTGFGDKFIMSCLFEHKDVMGGGAISGVNAEEQSDIALTFHTRDALPSNPQKTVDVFVNYDALLIIDEGNMIRLIE